MYCSQCRVIALSPKALAEKVSAHSLMPGRGRQKHLAVVGPCQQLTGKDSDEPKTLVTSIR